MMRNGMWKTVWGAVLLVMLGWVLSGCAATPHTAGVDSVEGTFGYFCACDASCDCKTRSRMAGKCGCGKELASKPVLRETATHYMVCGCSNCKCSPKQMRDVSTCGCGKQLVAFPKNMRMQCACAEGCGCKTQAQKPGKCQCNRPLVAR